MSTHVAARVEARLTAGPNAPPAPRQSAPASDGAQESALDSAAGAVTVRVAWGLVISCALAMVLLDGFVVVALRGVAGSIERTDHLFASWLREALLLLPAYVSALLVAVMLVSRGPGGARRYRHPSVTMLGALSAAGTVVATVWATTSGAYDLRLQRHEFLDMPAMQAACTGACAERMQQAAFTLQEHTVGLAAVAFLVGNLVMVLWVYALRGGLLLPAPHPLASPRTATPSTAERLAARRRRWERVRSDRRANLRCVVAISMLGAAVIHLAVVPEHLVVWPLAAVFFVLLSLGELCAGALVLARPSRLVVVASGLLAGLPIALWTLSRSRGLPFGPEPGAAEAVGFADVAACTLELVTLAACLLLLRAGPWLRGPAVGTYAAALGLTSVLAVTTLGLGGSALPGVHAFGVAGHGEGSDQTALPTHRLPGALVPPSQLDPG